MERGLLTIQELVVRPGEEEEFASRFEQLDVLRLAADAADGGLLEATLARDGQRFRVVTIWASAEGIDGWIASPARERVRAALEPLYAEPPTVTRHGICSRYSS